MKKIKTITLKNFKYFYGTEEECAQNKIDLEQNNLLLYGENGSGKSSIYWALYTFLQSAIKTDDNEIYKYFRPDKSENLRNRFAKDDAESGIKIYFEDEQKVEESREISNLNINTKHGTFVEKTLISSDFINYKYLAKLYDFRNSEPIDLFPLFVREIFMFVDFDGEFNKHDGTPSGTTNAGDWWKFIEEGHKDLPYNKNIISVSSHEYKRYKEETIPKFIEHLKSFLLTITEATNKYLKDEFKENFKIDFEVDKITCDFNKHISTRSKDGKLHEPTIPLKVILLDPELEEAKTYVDNPHTFLNEARLTAIALALRLAIIDDRPKLTDSSRLLVLDDLLLSLDMSHRNIVLDIILRKSSDFQLLILTHDKLFFEMAHHKIKRLEQENWKYIEMYAHKKDKIPQPLIYEKESYIGKAERFYDLKEYEIAGNFLRKEAEDFCKEFLPDKYKFNLEGKLKDLSTLISEALKYCEANGLDQEPFKDLNAHRAFVLNPSSHDSYDVPKFSSEIANCIKTLKTLRKIKTESFLPKGTILFFDLKETAGDTYKFKIRLEGDFRLIKEPGNDSVISKEMINYKIAKNGVVGELQHRKQSLKKMYESAYNTSDKSTDPDYWNSIIIQSSNQPISTVRKW